MPPRDEAVDAGPDKDRYRHRRPLTCGRLTIQAPFPIPLSSLRFREPVKRSVRILGKRTFGQNLQVLFVVFLRFGLISEFFLALGDTEAGNGVAILVVESFLVALERGFVVLSLEVGDRK